jgi:hypothetical protein
MKEKRMSMNDKMEGNDIKELVPDASTMAFAWRGEG